MKYVMLNGEVVEVVDRLSSQFTVLVNGKIKFLFYRDKGIEWEPVKSSHTCEKQ